MSAEENAALARTMYDAFNRRDLTRVLASATEDVQVVTITFGQTLQVGHDGLRQVMEGWTTMAPDCRVEIIGQWPGTEGVTNECRFRGTQTGPWQSPTAEAEILPTGRTFDVPFSAVWQMTEGKVGSLYTTIDIMTMLRQLGVTPLPAIPQRYLHFALDAPAAELGAVSGPGDGVAA